MTKPITPQEVTELRITEIPPGVIEAFNKRIARHFNGTQAKVIQDDVVKDLVNTGYERKDIFDNNWLDVEPIYEQAGWRVEYDKPGYNEDYKAFFIFKRKLGK